MGKPLPGIEIRIHEPDASGVGEVLAREARKRAVDYDDWFLREVETGLAQIDA